MGMAKDGRLGIENVFNILFPGMEYKGAKSSLEVKPVKNAINVKQEVISRADDKPVSTTPTLSRKKRGPASRVKMEHRPTTTTREEEDVDDPSNGISPPKTPKL